jgi:hypothetical protein
MKTYVFAGAEVAGWGIPSHHNIRAGNLLPAAQSPGGISGESSVFASPIQTDGDSLLTECQLTQTAVMLLAPFEM